MKRNKYLSSSSIKAKEIIINMILDHKKIGYKGKVLFSWITLTTPNENDLMLPPEACVAYISEGDGQQLFAQEVISANPKSVIVSTCGRTVGHMIAKQEKGRVSSIIAHFHVDQLEDIYKDSKPKLWKELEKPITTFVTQAAADNLIIKYFEGVAHFFNNREAVSEDILALKIQELILLLLQSESSNEIKIIINNLFSKRVFSFIDVVDTYIFMPISIEGLAHLTNKSLSSFKREFKRIYKATPGSYIIEKRLERVAEELVISDLPIQTIAYDCGFSSSAHLSRTFKKKYNASPSKFRMDSSVK